MLADGKPQFIAVNAIYCWFVDFSTQLCMESVTIPANFTSRSICDKTHLLM